MSSIRFTPILALLGAFLAAPSQAAMVDVSLNSGAEDETFEVLGSRSGSTEYFSSQAGSVRLSLLQVPWGALLSTLSTTISLTGRDDLHMNGYAPTIFDVAQNERFAANVYAVAAGIYRYGAYRVDIQFTPRVSTVPLPAAGWLLLAGVAALAGRSRRRRPAPSMV
jgi:hypothetical protein